LSDDMFIELGDDFLWGQVHQYQSSVSMVSDRLV